MVCSSKFKRGTPPSFKQRRRHAAANRAYGTCSVTDWFLFYCTSTRDIGQFVSFCQWENILRRWRTANWKKPYDKQWISACNNQQQAHTKRQYIGHMQCTQHGWRKPRSLMTEEGIEKHKVPCSTLSIDRPLLEEMVLWNVRKRFRAKKWFWNCGKTLCEVFHKKPPQNHQKGLTANLSLSYLSH